MEQMRLLLAIVLSFLVFVVWQWLVVEPEVAKQTQQPATTSESTLQHEDAAPSQTETIAPKSTLAPGNLPSGAAMEPTPENREARSITVETPLYTAILSEKGAALDDLVLKKYRESVDAESPRKDMIQDRARLINLKTGGDSQQFGGMENALYHLDTEKDVIVVQEEGQSIDFQWVNNDGIRVRKQFVFNPDSYLIELNVSIENQTVNPISDRLGVKISHVVNDPSSRITFEGAMAYVDNSLEEIKIKDIAEKPGVEGTFRWLGVTDRYFMTVLIPEEAAAGTMRMETVGEDMVVSTFFVPETMIPQGEVATFAFKALIGPKETEMLSQANYELGKAVNFGMFDFLAKPFLWIMNQIYKVIPNYGIAIILLTLLTKIILWPLGNKSYKSMNDMKRMQPLMSEIREKYKDDKKKMNEETMALYRTYKINPMGGCLPMIVQLPVFFALYRMLYQAIELRHASFFGWINDLSSPDRLFEFGFSIPFMEPPHGIPVLTIVMGATMFLQQKMSPPPGDPTQAKMMMFMPIIFTVIFINFPAGLVLYWLTNNVFSIAQQYYIQKKYA